MEWSYKVCEDAASASMNAGSNAVGSTASTGNKENGQTGAGAHTAVYVGVGSAGLACVLLACLCYVRAKNERQKVESMRKAKEEMVQAQMVSVLAIADDQANQLDSTTLPIAKAVASSNGPPIPIAFVAGSLESSSIPGARVYARE
jgi:hypothetical protein